MGYEVLYFLKLSYLLIMEILVIGVLLFFIVLEYNNNCIEGNFLVKIIKDVLFGVIVVLLNVFIIFSVVYILGFDVGIGLN